MSPLRLPRSTPPRFALLACRLAGLALLSALALPSQAQTQGSALDAPLFYQLLIGEMEQRNGQSGTAFQVMMEAARRTRDEAVYRRAVEIAVLGRSPEQALSAARAWRQALPQSLDALRYAVQLLVATDRYAEAVEPLRTLIALPPDAERGGRIASVPRLFARATDKRQAATLVEQVLKPWLDAGPERGIALTALARGWQAADPARSLKLLQQAHEVDRSAEGPALLALELMSSTPSVESIVVGYLASPQAAAGIRMVYARTLTAAQRYTDALPQLEAATKTDPKLAPAWLSLGALHLELRHPKEADAALQRYLELGADASQEEDEGNESSGAGPTQARLMLAQAAEQRQDFQTAEKWLAQIENPQRVLEVQARRASLLARQGRVQQARELLRSTPERTGDDGRAKLLAEAHLLRDQKLWSDAHGVLIQANERFKDDVDLLYEQAMAAEKLQRVDEMEALLKRVIALKPDHHHAYNALGYTLADRNQRLPEARDFIRKALDLAPGDPFITDSLGWVEFRLGNRDEALRLLHSAYRTRPDVEIGTHLGEVLWVNGQRDEARRIWREARERDASNEVLRETLARLRVDL
jgi:tetratricopeptide (TPR) repeat protein